MSKNKKKNTSKKKDSPILLVVGFMATLVVLFGFMAFIQHHGKDQGTSQLETSYSKISTKGDTSASVHIVEFGDYKCPFCKDFNETTIPYILKNYVETGDAQFHFVNYSFIGLDSEYLAQYTETVRQELGEDTFWLFHDSVYANQGNESEVWGTEEYLTDLLKEIVSDKEVETVLQAVKEGKYKENIEDQNQMARNMKVQGTPAIYLNGEAVEFTTYDELFAKIEDAINKK
jgi:protein-disulfide isomerase